MRRLYNLARGSQVPARLLNGLQDEQLGLIAATDTAGGATAIALSGADGRWWTSPTAGIPDGELRVLDTSVDWRSRRVWGVFRALGGAARRPGQADDHIPNDPTAAPNARMFNGWTGSGGLGAAAATVANGTPPTIADDQYAVLLDEGATTADRVWLYARPSDGALCLYNDSGAVLHAELLVWGAAAAVTAGAVPSVYPSPIYVLWLTPSLAADRPVTPSPAEQIALHRATDTGTVTLWDGGAWRTVGITLPSGAASQALVHDGSGWTARARIFYGTAVARDASAALDGDVWVVTSGAGTGTTWIYATTWQQLPIGASATVIRAILGVQDGPRVIPLFALANSSSASPATAGFGQFLPSDYAITGRTTLLALECIGQVSGAGLTGTVEILDCADDGVVATLSWTETVPTLKSTSITLPGVGKIYRARVSCTGVTNPATEYALFGGCNTRITWS